MNEARPVSSNQHGPHEDTVAVVERHLSNTFKSHFRSITSGHLKILMRKLRLEWAGYLRFLLWCRREHGETN